MWVKDSSSLAFRKEIKCSYYVKEFSWLYLPFFLMHIWVIFVISYVGWLISIKNKVYVHATYEVWEGDVAGVGYGWSPSYEAKGTRAYTDRHKYITEKLCESIWIIGGWYSLVCLLYVVLNNKIFSAFRTTSVHTHSLVGHNYNIVSTYTYTPTTNHIRSWGWWRWLHIWRSCRKDDRQRWVYLSVAHLPQQHTHTPIRYFASNMWNERYPIQDLTPIPPFLPDRMYVLRI